MAVQDARNPKARVMQKAKEYLLPDGSLSSVAQERVHLSECYAANELFLVAGDTHIYACVSLDGKQIGSGKPGPVMKRVSEMLERDARVGDDDHIDL